MKLISKHETLCIGGGSFEGYSSDLVIPAAGIGGLTLGLIAAKVFEIYSLPSEVGFIGAATIGLFGTLLTADFLEISTR